MAEQIKVGELVYKITGDASDLSVDLKKAETEVTKLKSSLEKTEKPIAKIGESMGFLKKALIGFVTGFVATKLVDFITSAVDASLELISAQTKLASTVRVATNATDEQIQSLFDQANALEKVGVVSEEAILTGQAQLAAFDLTASSIEKLTPTLLDYVVAENGMNASAEATKSIANGLGKALQGQTDALVKGGFQFTKAQINLLKTGTETERVTALTEILDSTYQGLNKTMGDSLPGQILHAKNAFDDIKKTIGFSLLPAVNVLMKGLFDIGGNMEVQAKTANNMGRVFYQLAQFIVAIGFAIKSASAVIKIAFNGIQNTFIGGAEVIVSTFKIIAKSLGQNTDLIDTALLDLNKSMETNSQDINDALATIDSATEDFNKSMGEALDPKKFKEITTQDIKAFNALGKATTDLGKSSDEATKEMQGLQDKLLNVLDTVQKVKKGFEGDVTESIKKFSTDLNSSFVDSTKSITDIVINAQNKIRDLKADISANELTRTGDLSGVTDSQRRNEINKDRDAQKKKLEDEIATQQKILDARVGYEERQAKLVADVRAKLEAANINATEAGLDKVLSIKSLEDQIAEARRLDDLGEFARKEEENRLSILSLTDNLIAEITLIRGKIEQQQALEADLTKFISTQTNLRKADVDSFAKFAIQKYGDIANALKDTITLQQRLNTLRDAPDTGKPQFHNGGYVGGAGGEVHAGEYVIPANMVSQLGGLINQIDSAKNGQSINNNKTINAPISISGNMSDGVDVRSIGREFAWEIERL